jgi:hypothetical protein
MPKTNVLLWHLANGEIVAVARAVGKHRATAIAGEGQLILETDVEEQDIKGLHRSHIVDTQAKKLIRHGDRKRL